MYHEKRDIINRNLLCYGNIPNVKSFRKRNSKLTRKHGKRRNISITEEGMHYDENIRTKEGIQQIILYTAMQIL
jgi:hypothetical protein